MTCLFVEQLTVIDSSRLDPVEGLVGESWIVDVELTGELDAQGMVFDFGDVKRTLKDAVDGSVDHRLLVPADSASIHRAGDAVAVDFQSQLGWFRMRGPAHAVVEIPGHHVDAGSVRDVLHRTLRPCLPDNVTELGLRLRREAIDTAWYAYSHGLAAHQGACQRIAHGHRSRLEIHRNGVRAPDWERYWEERWQNVYLGTREHLIDSPEYGGVPHHRFGYRSCEGEYSLELPAAVCELLETESTVERIAEHLLAVMKQREPAARFSVCAFEGVGKGARATG